MLPQGNVDMIEAAAKAGVKKFVLHSSPGKLSLSPSHPSVLPQGNINVIEAAAKAGVKKFVLVTSVGAGDSKDATPPNVYEVLKPVLVEKEKAEQRLKVRPGLLFVAFSCQLTRV